MEYEDFINEWVNNEDFIVVRTSGSTGIPKEIKLPKPFVANSARRTIDFFNILPSHHIHSCISPDYIGGKMMAVRSIISGASLSWEKPSNRPLADFGNNKTIDLLAIVPSQMIHLLENQKKLPLIRNIIIGGSPLNPELRKKIAVSGFNAFETYGMTETASHIALRRICHEEVPFETLKGIKVGSTEDECLTIAFETGEKFVTNDLCTLISDTNFFIKGRKDDIIISGGKKINPLETESKIDHLINSSFCLTSLPDEKWGQKLVLLIRGNYNSESTEKLKKDLKEVLNNWEVPKEIFYVKELPSTSSGKKLRRISLSSLSILISPSQGKES